MKNQLKKKYIFDSNISFADNWEMMLPTEGVGEIESPTREVGWVRDNIYNNRDFE